MQRVLVICLVLGACVDPALDRASSVRRALVNATETTDYPAVVKIQRPVGICTATLIGLQTLLTAAHCVPAGETEQVLIDGKSWPVEQTLANPGFNMEIAQGLFHDVGVIRLATPPPLKPVVLAIRPPTVGQQVTLVGYGSGSGPIGVKRAGTNKVSQVTNALVVIDGSANGAANTCLGDSGGPVFATIDGVEVQVGVHSTMIGPCGQQSNATRVDAYLDWIIEASQGDVTIATLPPDGGLPDAGQPDVATDAPPADASALDASYPADAGPADGGPTGESGCALARAPDASAGWPALVLLAWARARRCSRASAARRGR